MSQPGGLSCSYQHERRCALSRFTLTDGLGGTGTSFAPREVRRRVLRETFGFDCRCQKCELTGAMLEESDARMEAVGDDERITSDLHVCASHRVNACGHCHLAPYCSPRASMAAPAPTAALQSP